MCDAFSLAPIHDRDVTLQVALQPLVDSPPPAPPEGQPPGKKPELPASASGTYTLVVQAEPADSTIVIVNIEKPYQPPGIALPPGRYDLLVKHEGYRTHREFVEISDRDVTRDIKLREVGY